MIMFDNTNVFFLLSLVFAQSGRQPGFAHGKHGIKANNRSNTQGWMYDK